MVQAPVVLHISSIGKVVPVAAGLHRILLILLGITEEVVGKIIACEGPVELERALRISKVILNLFVDRPTETKLELVRALRQGNIVSELVVVRLIDPRRPVRCVGASSAAI